MPTKVIAPVAMRPRSDRLAFTLQRASRSTLVPSAVKLQRWAEAAAARPAAVTLRIVGTREGRSLNLRHRGRDYATNVLTFVYDDTEPLSGDIALCAPVIAREARAQGKTAEAHYAHLVVHGMLHLQGYDHVSLRSCCFAHHALRRH